jgi:hypothetical protein
MFTMGFIGELKNQINQIKINLGTKGRLACAPALQRLDHIIAKGEAYFAASSSDNLIGDMDEWNPDLLTEFIREIKNIVQEVESEGEALAKELAVGYSTDGIMRVRMYVHKNNFCLALKEVLSMMDAEERSTFQSHKKAKLRAVVNRLTK